MMRIIERNFSGTFMIKFFVAACLLASAILFSLGNMFNSDEGLILNGAWKMYLGQNLYTDFFSFIAPGSYLFTYGTFVLFGPTYMAARIASIALILAGLWALWRLGRELTRSPSVAFTSAALWFCGVILLTVTINYNPLSSVFAILALYGLVRAIGEQRLWRFALAGFCTGAVILFLQTKGLITFAGLIILLVLFMRKGIITRGAFVWWGAGAALLPASALVWWGMGNLFAWLIMWPLNHYLPTNKVSFLPFLTAVLLFGSLSYWLLAGHFRRDPLRVEGDSLRRNWIILIVVQGALLASTFNRPDLPHIMWNSFGIIVMGIYAASEWARDIPHARQLFYEIPALFLFFSALGYASVALQIEQKSVALQERHRITSVYAHPFLPQFPFLFGITDPYHYGMVLTDMFPQEAFQENLAALRREQPDYVLTNYAMVAKFRYRTNNPLDEYIRDAYEPVERVGDLTVMKRRAD